MRGAVLYGPRDVRVDERPDPGIIEPTDAVIRLSATCICGSDLWPYRGFNAASGQYENLVAAGVIDPTKVTRTALQNASSISALMLTTEAMICEIPEKKSAPAGGPGGHGPEMDY